MNHFTMDCLSDTKSYLSREEDMPSITRLRVMIVWPTLYVGKMKICFGLTIISLVGDIIIKWLLI